MIWRPNVTMAAIAERDGRFLLVEEQADGRVVLNQPAGHLDEGESLLRAVARETLEESGWHFAPRSLVGVYRWRSPDNGVTYLRFGFAGELLRHEPERPLDRGIVRTLWLTPAELARERGRHRSPQVQRCVDDFLTGQRYPLSVLKDFHEI